MTILIKMKWGIFMASLEGAGKSADRPDFSKGKANLQPLSGKDNVEQGQREQLNNAIKSDLDNITVTKHEQDVTYSAPAAAETETETAVTLPLSHSPEFSHSPLTGSSAAANGYIPFPKFEEPRTDGRFMQDSAANLLKENVLMDWTEREKETRKLIQPDRIESQVMFKANKKNIIIFGIVKSIYQEKSRCHKDVEVPLKENREKLFKGANIRDGYFNYYTIDKVIKEGDVLTITTDTNEEIKLIQQILINLN